MAVELPFALTLIRIYLITLISSVHPANITHIQGQGLFMRDGDRGALPRYLPVTSPDVARVLQNRLTPCTQGWSGSLTPGPDPSLRRDPHAMVGSVNKCTSLFLKPLGCQSPHKMPHRELGQHVGLRDEHRETPAQTATGPVLTSCQPHISCPSVPGPPMPEPG